MQMICDFSFRFQSQNESGGKRGEGTEWRVESRNAKENNVKMQKPYRRRLGVKKISQASPNGEFDCARRLTMDDGTEGRRKRSKAILGIEKGKTKKVEISCL